jgi:hypothetical protein
MVRPVFLGLENHKPRFMNNQNAAGRLKLNQLAKSAVYVYQPLHETEDARRGWAYHKTKQVTENWNRSRNHPGDDPESHGDTYPGSHCPEIPLVHVGSAGEDTSVYGLAGDVPVYHASDNNLPHTQSLVSRV